MIAPQHFFFSFTIVEAVCWRFTYSHAHRVRDTLNPVYSWHLEHRAKMWAPVVVQSCCPLPGTRGGRIDTDIDNIVTNAGTDTEQYSCKKINPQALFLSRTL